MITVTFNPQNSEQVSILARAMAEMLGAADASVEQVEETTAPKAEKKPRATKAQASAPVESATSPSSTQDEAATTSGDEAPNAAAESTPAQEVETKESNASSPTSSVSLETVRGQLAALSTAGKAAEVKALIASFGAAKLTDIPVEKYADLLKQAEAL